MANEPTDPRADLIWVVEELRRLLSQTVEVLGSAYLPDELMDAYSAAWPEVTARFDVVMALVRDAKLDELKDHGLTVRT